jgi:hypothetical protein
LLARANADGLRDKIDNYVRGYADVGLFNGVVLVSKGDSTVYEGAFRLANRTFAVPNKVDANAIEADHRGGGFATDRIGEA